MKKHLKIKILLIILTILSINQIYYLNSLQFKCTDKINKDKDLNTYEILSAIQTHINMGIFGFIVEPSVALSCIEKQLHINTNIVSIPDDDKVLINAKENLKSKKFNNIKLAWNKYNSKASILLNGSTISYLLDDGIYYYMYKIDFDYKPGIIKICGIVLSETVFDYLENKGILSTMTKYAYQKVLD